MVKKLGALVASIPLRDVTPVATMERLILARVALGLTQNSPSEHHRIAGIIIKQGMALLEIPGLDVKEELDICT